MRAIQRTSALLVLAVAAVIAVRPAGAAPVVQAGFQDTVAFDGLSRPTAVRFARDGRIFVAEKSGLVKMFASAAATTPVVFADLRTNVMDYWDRGLLGLALHPDFPATPYVYVLYTMDAPIGGTPPVYHDACTDPTGHGCVVGARLSRLEVGNGGTAGRETVLIENWCQQYPSHSIGTLAFGSDGALYAGAGDGASFSQVDYGQGGNPPNPCGDPPGGPGGALSPPTALGGALRAQNLGSLDGKIIRVDPLTGAALPDHPPAANGSDPRVVAAGFRNPFRFTVRPGTDELWVGDVGWTAWEEIDRVTVPAAGVPNFGWPCDEGAEPQPSYAAAGLAACTALEAAGTATAPFFAYDHADPVVPGEDCALTHGSSITGIAFYPGGTYPASYGGALFFADYSRACIWAMFPRAGGSPDPASRITFATHAPAVDLEVSPEGDLWYVDLLGGAVHRIRYYPGDAPPVAVAHADVTTGPVPLTVHFDGRASSDPDAGDPITFSWDLDGDGVFGDSTDPAPAYTYTTPGTYTVGLQVTDSHGVTAGTRLVIGAGETPPVPTILTPLAGSTWSVGDRIAFAGTATDAEDGVLPAPALDWSLVLHHCPSECHEHPLEDFTGVAAGSFVTPDHDYPSYLELRLTATDSHGLSATTSVVLRPETVDLAFDSAPPGLALAVGTEERPAPFIHTVIRGSRAAAIAASPQSLGAAHWHFVAWSDGGPQSHELAAATAPATYVATFARDCPGTCGDGVVEAGCEQCDLGPANCAPGTLCASGCTSDCRVIGRCTSSRAACTTAADCAPGEGCCGNGIREPGEQCDDGNLLDGDCCSSACRVEPAGRCEPQACPATGPHLRPITGATVVIDGRTAEGTSRRWRTAGRLALGPGASAGPDAHGVQLRVTQHGADVCRAAVGAGAFAVRRAVCPRRWHLRPQARGPHGVGLRQALLRQPRRQGRGAPACLARLGYTLRGAFGSLVPVMQPGLVRQSLRLGDDCYTALLSCHESAGGRLVCHPAATPHRP